MSMKLLAVVTTQSIYHDCSTRKTLWEENFTLGEFTPMNIKIAVVSMSGNTERLVIVRITPSWIYC